MLDPTVPPPGGQWSSDVPPTSRQDHCVLAWLAVEADLPLAVQAHVLDALVAWTPLMGPDLFPIEPEAGVDCDRRQVLDAIWWRRDDQGLDASWADRVALYEVRGRLGLALAELRRTTPTPS